MCLHKIFYTLRNGALSSAQSYPVNTSVAIPEYINGTYYLIYETDVFNQVYEYIFENNNFRISTPVNIILAPPADLVPISLALPANVDANAIAPVSWSVANEGANPSLSSWRDKIFLTQEDTLNTINALLIHNQIRTAVLGVDSVYNIAINKAMPANIAGTFNAFLYTDAENTELEIYEDNNIFGPVPVLLRVPDLLPEEMDHPLSVTAGQTYVLNYRIRNSGIGKLVNRELTDHIYAVTGDQSAPDSIHLLQSISAVANIDPMTYISRQATFIIPDGWTDSLYLLIHTNFDNTIFENGDSLNNLLYSDQKLSVLLPPYPDLAGLSITSSDTLYAGSVHSITHSATNLGPGSISGKSWQDRVYLSTDTIPESGQILYTSNHSNNLAAGSQYSVTRSFTVPPSVAEGYYYLKLNTDVNNNVYEHGGLENNYYISPDSVYVVGYPLSDIAITEVQALPDTIWSGMDLNIQFRIANIGSGVVSGIPWNDAIYFSYDSIWSNSAQKLAELIRTTTLLPGADYMRNMQVTLPQGISGSIYLYAVTDPAFKTNDLDTTNNIVRLTSAGFEEGDSTVVFLSPSPDLVVSQVTCPTNAIGGQPLTIIYTVANNGNAGLIDRTWSDRLFLHDQSTPGGQILHTVTRKRSLPVGGSYTDTILINLPLVNTGNYYLLLMTDASNMIYEHEAENNNYNSRLITIQAAPPSDLIVEQISSSADSTQNGQLLTVYWNTRNLGSNPVDGVMTEAVYFSRDSVWDHNAILVGTITSFYQIVPMGFTPSQMSFVVDGVPYGNNYTFVRTDLKNNIPEIDENNNITTGPQVYVGVKYLPLDQLTSDVLIPGTNLFYRVHIPDVLEDETLRITLTGDTISGYNESYVRFNTLPGRYNYEYSHTQPFQGRQEVTVPDLLEGDYFNLSYGTTASNQVQDITLLATIQQFTIDRVVSHWGSNTGKATIRISGARFEQGMTAIIKRDDLGLELHAEDLVYFDPAVVYATFDLRAGRTDPSGDRIPIDIGFYDVILVKKNGQSAALNQSYEVRSGGNSLVDVNLIYPPQNRIGVLVPITIDYANISGKDIEKPRFMITSLDNMPIGRSPTDLQGVRHYSEWTNLPIGYREVLIELTGNEKPESDFLRAGATGQVIIYAWMPEAGTYNLKVIDIN